VVRQIVSDQPPEGAYPCYSRSPQMAKDVRQLRDEAAKAASDGKHKRALECYAELERLESQDAQWPKRIAETYRKLGKSAEAVTAYERAADRYAQNGFLVQAIAVCKLILQIAPNHISTQQKLATISAEQSVGPSRLGRMSTSQAAYDSAHSDEPSAGESASFSMSDAVPLVVEAVETSGLTLRPPSMQPTPPLPIARPKTRSSPITLAPGTAIDSVALGSIVPGSHQMRGDGSSPGIMVIPLGDDDPRSPVYHRPPSSGGIVIDSDDDAVELDASDFEEAEELELGDIEEVPLPAPKRISDAAKRALQATPLFADMSPAALERLIAKLDLRTLANGEVLFREGDAGDALYIVTEGEVSVATDGPPRVEMQRLGAGSFFGEVALVTDTPRTATVSAATTCELLKVSRETLAILLDEHPAVLGALLRFVRDRLVDRWTRTSPLFSPFDNKERLALVARFRFLEIEAKSKIVLANSKPDGLYILLAGKAEMVKGGRTLAMVGPGELLGENALLGNVAGQVEVVASSKCFALCLPAADFREIIMTHPHVLEYVGEQAEQRQRLSIY
jgi:CRP-like cAMP-binding protein